MADGADQFWNINSCLLRNFLGQNLVVYKRVEVARIVRADVAAVAHIHSHDTYAGKFERRGIFFNKIQQHFYFPPGSYLLCSISSTSGLKRLSSDRRYPV